jgi:hypothetical protein
MRTPIPTTCPATFAEAQRGWRRTCGLVAFDSNQALHPSLRFADAPGSQKPEIGRQS